MLSKGKNAMNRDNMPAQLRQPLRERLVQRTQSDSTEQISVLELREKVRARIARALRRHEVPTADRSGKNLVDEAKEYADVWESPLMIYLAAAQVHNYEKAEFSRASLLMEFPDRIPDDADDNRGQRSGRNFIQETIKLMMRQSFADTVMPDCRMRSRAWKRRD